MIGLVGTLILLPLVLIGLVVGLVRFAVRAVGALADAGFGRLAHR